MRQRCATVEIDHDYKKLKIMGRARVEQYGIVLNGFHSGVTYLLNWQGEKNSNEETDTP